MRTVTKRARTVEEAVSLALAELGVPREDVDVKVVSQGRAGLFGVFGREDAEVRVTWRPDKAQAAGDFVQAVARHIGVEAAATITADDETIHIDLHGPDLAVLIGRHGQTLDALQYITNVAVARLVTDRRRVVIDVEGYRKRREETLSRLALRLAERVQRSGKPVALEPMSAVERRVIHLALQDVPGVVTRSEGEEPFRKIIIAARR